MKYANFGTVSHATLRNEDLLPAFADELERLARAGKCLKLYRDLIREARNLDPGHDVRAAEVLDDLSEALSNFAPPYFYFGAHEGDGSDFGFWLGSSALEDFDGLKVSDTSEIPKGYTGEVLHINDHGNATLYACTRGRCREVWAVV